MDEFYTMKDPIILGERLPEPVWTMRSAWGMDSLHRHERVQNFVPVEAPRPRYRISRTIRRWGKIRNLKRCPKSIRGAVRYWQLLLRETGL